jgi:hypothetical protein
MIFILPALAASLCDGPQLPATTAQVADPPPPVVKGSTPAAPAPAADPASAAPAPPPSAPAKRSAADLEKLVAPLALFPDPLIATMLPASVYPLEIVQAARFVADTNNLAKLDAQPWDQNVKAVARIPDAIKKMNDDLTWTMELGDAFLAQDKDVMDAIQNLRGKAQKAGTLQTTPQQVVVVTNLVVVQTNATQVVTVTNQIVQIQPSNPSVVYVPTYNPTTVYYPPPAYVYDPIAPLVTFTAGVAMGAIIANNCDWWHGGCYHGDVDVDVDVDRNVNRNVNRNTDRAGNTARTTQAGARPSTTQKKWQPDQSRLRTSGSSGATASARTAEARGWSSGGARPATQPGAAARPAASPGNVGARPSTGTPAARPSTGTPSASRPSTSQGASRPSPSPSASANRPAPSASRPSSSGSAFDGVSSGASARNASSRGASSRGGGSGGGRGGGRR